jgi:hypothetical protein
MPRTFSLDFRSSSPAWSGLKKGSAPSVFGEVRNLVHPARYLKDRKGKEYTHEELRTLYATCQAVCTCLENKVYQAYPELRTA